MSVKIMSGTGERQRQKNRKMREKRDFCSLDQPILESHIYYNQQFQVNYHAKILKMSYFCVEDLASVKTLSCLKKKKDNYSATDPGERNKKQCF